MSWIPDSPGPAVRLSSGASMPLLGFGTWQLRGAEAYRAFRGALDVGYRLVDTATVYGNEAGIGRALRDSRIARGDVFVTTKLPPGNAGSERATIDASLRHLGLDHVDLWLVHWPPADRFLVRTWERFLTLSFCKGPAWGLQAQLRHRACWTNCCDYAS